MSTELTAPQNTALAPRVEEFDPFAEYVRENSTTRIVGRILKFVRGDYLVGQNGDLMQEGSQLCANMDELYVGFIKWKDKKPVEQAMGRIKDAFKKPKREELGDLDEDQWDKNEDGELQDPWQETNYLLMKMPGVDDQDALFTFTASSWGGRNAITNLIDSYVKMSRMRSKGEMPIVKLGVERYTHKKYGPMKNPTFKIVGWVAPHEFAAALEQEAAQAEADAAARKIDDEIPF